MADRVVLRGSLLDDRTDSGVYAHGLNARQLPYLVRYGMTTLEAIRWRTSGS
jgi:imidazolonepropionase-like amidohydrolase